VVKGTEIDHHPDPALFADDFVEQCVDWVDGVKGARLRSRGLRATVRRCDVGRCNRLGLSGRNLENIAICFLIGELLDGFVWSALV
jgi:hypothetical protein